MYPCTLLNTYYRTRSIGQWWVTGRTARHLWTLRVSDIEEGLRVPPVIVPCLHPSTDPFHTRTDMSLRRGIKYHGETLTLSYKLAGTGTVDLPLLLFRFGSRSATATPTGSPKKRQLPQIPAALKERVTQDFEERARFMRHRNRQSIYRSTGMGGESQRFLSGKLMRFSNICLFGTIERMKERILFLFFYKFFYYCILNNWILNESSSI